MLRNHSSVATVCQNSKYKIMRMLDLDTSEYVLAKVSLSTQDNPNISSLLEQEFELTKGLDSPQVLKAKRTAYDSDGNCYLLFEDFQGVTLRDLIGQGQRPSLDACLTIAEHIAWGINAIHAAEIIHKNINPESILISPGTLRTVIHDFSLATRLPRESHEIHVKGAMTGLLPYISPEQTGRMNRFLDYRTDYYSFGATLYELISGKQMINAEDALGYVSAHISKKPAPLFQEGSNAQINVSRLIETLTHKSAEQRYQSSLGIIHDIQAIQKGLQGRVGADGPVLELKTQDISERFVIPQLLYGRDQDISNMNSLFREALNGNLSLLLVQGPAGIGKSALIHEISKIVASKQSLFLRGKFDQFTQNSPYSAFIQAFAKISDQINRLSREEYQSFQERLSHVLGPNATLIANLIPEIDQVISKPKSMTSSHGSELKTRVQQTIADFIQVICDHWPPLVLFLDDMQWADISTITLLESICLKKRMRNLLIILSFRPQEVAPHHPLAMALAEIQKSLKIETIVVNPLTVDDVYQMTCDIVKAKDDRCREVARIIHQKTGGNPFFIEQLFKRLYDDKLITFDRTQGQWNFDPAQIAEVNASTNIIEFLLEKIEKLDPLTVSALKVASCLGNRFALSSLAQTMGQSSAETARILHTAISDGLIIPLDAGYQNHQLPDEIDLNLKFQHDKVQQAFYSTVPEAERSETHLRIARMHSKKLSAQPSLLVEVARHYMSALSLLHDDSEILSVMVFLLAMAVKSKMSNAYQPAEAYIQAAQKLIRLHHWNSQYGLLFDIQREACDIAFRGGKTDEGLALARELLKVARDDKDRLSVLRLEVTQLPAAGRFDESIDAAVKALALVNHPIPKNPRLLHVGLEVLHALWQQGFRDPRSFASQPPIAESRHQLALDILIRAAQTAYVLGKQDFYAFCLLRSVNIAMKHGKSDESTYVYLVYAAVLTSVLKMVKRGRGFAELGTTLYEDMQNISIKSKASLIIPSFLTLWHFKHDSLEDEFKECLRLTYLAGNNFDRSFAATLMEYYLPRTPITRTFEQMKVLQGIVLETGVLNSYCNSRLINGRNANLIQRSDGSSSLNYDDFNEKSVFKEMSRVSNGSYVAAYFVFKLEVQSLREKWRVACPYALKATQLMEANAGLFLELNFRFYKVLSLCHCLRIAGFWKRYVYKAHIHRERRVIADWARNNPSEFSHLRDIVEAVWASQTGAAPTRVITLFEAAIASSHRYSSKYQAIACQQAALFAQHQGLETLAQTWMTMAVSLFRKWGAEGLAQYLEHKHQRLLNGRFDSTFKESHVSGGGPSISKQSLDIETLYKASQSIASEVNVSRLTDSLLRALLENAGASRVCLILKDSDQLLVEADTLDWEWQRGESIDRMGSVPLPVTAIIQTARSLKSLVVHDIANDAIYRLDRYFQRSFKSAFMTCPIIQKGSCMGVIYLENEEAANAFTADRATLVEVLAAQMAISIENARLYETLDQQIRQRTQEIKAILKEIKQGILTIKGESLTVQQEYSAYLPVILETEDIAHKPIGELLLSQARLSADKKALVHEALAAMMGETLLNFELNSELLPREIEVTGADGSPKILELDWSPIANESEQCERILLTIRDVTRLRELQDVVQSNQIQMRMVYEILNLTPDKRSRFLETSQQHLTTCLDILAGGGPHETDLRRIYINLHTLKGNLRSLGIDIMTEQVHNVEEIYAAHFKSQRPFNLSAATADMKKLESIFHDYQHIAVKRLHLDQVGSASGILNEIADELSQLYHANTSLPPRLCSLVFKNLETLLADEIASLESLARELGKDAPLVSILHDDALYLPQTASILKQVFLHLFRNSMDHGIEDRDERRCKGKSPQAHIHIEVNLEKEGLEITYQDDGRGLALEQLTRRALAKGLIPEDRILTDAQQAELIFIPGFSTKDVASTVSGRGIGMDSVKEFMESLKGKVSINLGPKSQSGYRAFAIHIKVPKGHVVMPQQKWLKSS